MSVDLYSTPNWLDGQEIDLASLIANARGVRAQTTDQILQSMIASVANASTRPDFGGDDGADVSTLLAYAMSAGRAFLRQGSANNKIQIAPGTLLQKIGNSDGADSTLVPFTFAGTEEFALTNGDATNPRVDLLQMALSYTADTPTSVDFQDAMTRANTTVAGTATRRRIQCTLSVKAGTPAASPTVPDPDAGCVPVGTVVVGHGWTTGGNAPIFGEDTVDTNNSVVHDQRMPLGVRSLIVDPVLFKLETGAALADTNTTIRTSSGTNLSFVRCPTLTGRLLAVDVNTFQAISSTARLGRCAGAPLTALSSSFFRENGFGSNTVLSGLVARARRIDFESVHTPQVGPTIQQSATNKIGVPLWASGFRTPQYSVSQNPQNIFLRIQNIATNTNFQEVTFYLAG